MSALRIRDRLPFYQDVRYLYHWFGHRDARRELREAKSQLLKSPSTTAEDKQWLQAVSMKLHHADSMFVKGFAASYLNVGLSASHVIQQALAQRDKQSPIRSILDLPCGYGRVMRFLRVMFRDAEITSAEIDKGGVAFCQRTFSAQPFVSSTKFSSLSIGKKFDLIWCGSLLTHIAEQDCSQLLRFFHDHLTDQGVCIFSTHGQHSADSVKSKRTTYALLENDRQQLLQQYEMSGYGYVDYPDYPGYGISTRPSTRKDNLRYEDSNNLRGCLLDGWGHRFAREQPPW